MYMHSSLSSINSSCNSLSLSISSNDALHCNLLVCYKVRKVFAVHGLKPVSKMRMKLFRVRGTEMVIFLQKLIVPG